MPAPRPTLISALVLAAALLGACGDDDTSTDAAPTATESDAGASDDVGEDAGGATVTMEESRYAPGTLEVAAGTEVTFENLDPYAHTVTAAEGSDVEFDSGEMGQDETFTQTFAEPGTYEYFCEIHPTMRAEVVVS